MPETSNLDSLDRPSGRSRLSILDQPNVVNEAWIILLATLSFISTALLGGCAAQDPKVLATREQRPFFQAEQGTETHGRKNWLDRMIEVDPGKLQVEMASDYQDHPPAVIAVMPFADEGPANFTVDKIPVTFRNQKEQNDWAWTDAQRLRHSVMGYLAQREFTVVNPIAVDAVLKRRGIDNMKKLRQASPIELGRLLGADALVYGEVDNYEAFYFGLVSSYRVGVSTWMISCRDGETLMRETGSRYSVDMQPALSPQDIAVNSILTLLEFRDVTLARAEEEVSRELVLRIPTSEKLTAQLASDALRHADEVEAEEAKGDSKPVASDAIDIIKDLAAAEPFGRASHSHFGNVAFVFAPSVKPGATPLQ